MAAPGRKFSWNRLITNAFPNFARDDPNDVDLKPAQADLLLTYQLNLPHPRYLNEQAFLHAGIVPSESFSTKTHKALVKAKIILPVPAKDAAGGETMTVNTAGITKSFANKLAHISVHDQRKLIGLLFFWEEECTRWKLLDAEEAEVKAALDQNPGKRFATCGAGAGDEEEAAAEQEGGSDC